MSCRAKCATAPWSMCDHVRSVTHPNGPTSQQKEFLKLETKKTGQHFPTKKKHPTQKMDRIFIIHHRPPLLIYRVTLTTHKGCATLCHALRVKLGTVGILRGPHGSWGCGFCWFPPNKMPWAFSGIVLDMIWISIISQMAQVIWQTWSHHIYIPFKRYVR